MKKLITAIGNDNINKKLKELGEYEIICRDIQYQEALIEIIEEKETDILILSELIEGENKIEELIMKIKEINNNIEIIMILKKEDKLLEKFLKNNGINNIFYNNELSIINFKKEIKNINSNKSTINLEEVKKILLSNNSEKIKNKLKYVAEIKEKYLRENKKNILISINGVNVFKKSVFTVMLALILGRRNKKVLIIDLDILNKNFTSIFGVKKFPEKIEENLINKKVQELIININRNIDILSGLYLLIKNGFDYENTYKEIEKIKIEYDYIIINSSLENNFKLNKKIINKSNYLMFLTQNNLLNIKKSQNILDIYTNEWGINKDKLFIILNNKSDKNYLNEKIIKEIYKDYKIIKEIDLNKNYNLIINKDMKKLIINNEIRKEYNNLIKTIK